MGEWVDMKIDELNGTLDDGILVMLRKEGDALCYNEMHVNEEVAKWKG